MTPKIKRYNRKLPYTYTLGVFPTIEVLKSTPSKVSTIYIRSNTSDNAGIKIITELCKKIGIKLITRDTVFNKLGTKGNVYAIGIVTKYSTELEGNNNQVVLVNPSDMGNVGTIIRTMVGFSKYNLGIISPGVDLFHPNVIRASMGSIFKIHFSYFKTFEEYRKRFNNNLYSFFTDGKKSLEDMKFTKPYSLIFGNEGSGLPESIRNLSKTVKIRQSQEIDSLNLAVSVGISLFYTSI